MTDNTIWYLPRLQITEATRRFGMTPRAIRYYEEFGLVQPERDDKNRRFFDQKAQRRLQLIGELRNAGLSLNDIQDVLEADEENGDDGEAVALERLQSRLVALRAELAHVEEAIGARTASHSSDVTVTRAG